MACAYKIIRKAIKKIKLHQRKFGERSKMSYPKGIEPALNGHRKSGRTMAADCLLEGAVKLKAKSLTDKKKFEYKQWRKEQANDNRLIDLLLVD